MLVLVTRPRAQAEATARLLRAAGHEVLLDPLLEIHHLPPPTVVPGEVAAVAVTSANAAPAVAAIPPDLPVFAVGPATARALQAVGREPVGVADGNGRALADLLVQAISSGGTVLHFRGRDTREGLAGFLAAAGLAYRPAVVYEAIATPELAPATVAAIGEHRLDSALFYSPRSTALFVAGVSAAGLDRELAGVVAVCLSEAIAAELASLSFRHVRIAEGRDQKALLRRLEG